MRLTERYLGSTYQCQGGFTLWLQDWCHLQPPNQTKHHRAPVVSQRSNPTPPPPKKKKVDGKKSHTPTQSKSRTTTLLRAIHPFLRPPGAPRSHRSHGASRNRAFLLPRASVGSSSLPRGDLVWVGWVVPQVGWLKELAVRTLGRSFFLKYLMINHHLIINS